MLGLAATFGLVQTRAESDPHASAPSFAEAPRREPTGAEAHIPPAQAVGPTLGKVAALLPDDAELAHLTIDSGGGLDMQILAADPDLVRSAMAADVLLEHTRETDQSRTADGRMLITFSRKPAKPYPAGKRFPGLPINRLERTALAAGLLVERLETAGPGSSPVNLSVSGSEQAVVSFALQLEAGTALPVPVHFLDWSLAAVGGGSHAVRFSATAVPAVTDRAAVAPGPGRASSSDISRALFTAPVFDGLDSSGSPAAGSPVAARLPELVGIVGRLPDAAVAMVRLDSGRARALGLGESADGWRLETLARDAALFSRGSQHVRLELPPG